MTDKISKRKKDHLKIALSPEAQTGDAGFSRYRFVHNALPDIDFDEIDSEVTFLGKTLNHPFFVSCMTGGVEKGAIINKRLAKAAEKYGIAMGVGSQRAAVEYPKLKILFEVRKHAPTIPILANVGLVQLNYGFGIKEIETIIDMVDADALVFHINPIQEVIQPEGDKNFAELLPKLSKIINRVKVPVIAKEVGFGLSKDVAKKLYGAGVRIFDTAGWGGTSWSVVEGRRRSGWTEVGDLFGDWGIPTVDSIKGVVEFKCEEKDKDIVILGSGGVRRGTDIAKAIALGSDLVGLATPFAQASLVSQKQVQKLIEQLSHELKVSMFGVGAKNIAELQKISLLEL